MFQTKLMPKQRILIFILLLMLLVSSVYAAAPRNIILIIGDGMGIGAVTAARCAGPGQNGKLTLDTMPYTGFSITHPLGCLVTDSAAGGTALATGNKTSNGTVAMLPDGTRLHTILEAARDMGKSTGLITSDPVTGATPAAFATHVPDRGKVEDIAAQMIASRVTLLMGGGRKQFQLNTEKQHGRTDGRDLIADAKKRGYEVVFTPEEMKTSKADKLIGLFTEEDMDYENIQPSLADMSAKGIDILNRNSKGFFLMIESAGIDHNEHANNAAVAVKNVLFLDEALQKALDFAKTNGDTLIVVTADHETGGFAVQDQNKDNPKFAAQWTTGGHTANMVPIFAFGPGAELFTGVHQNTDLPKIMAKLWRTKL